MSDRDPNETDLFRRADYEDADIEELQRRAGGSTPRKLGLATTWKNRDLPVIQGAPSAIVTPDGKEVEAYSDPFVKTCGSCRHFDLKNGRKEIIKQRFAERLVREQEWKLKHLCVPPDSLGICGMSGGEMATTIVSKGCGMHREKSGGGGRWRL